MKISHRLREQAANFCSAWASPLNESAGDVRRAFEEAGVPNDAFQLAYDAGAVAQTLNPSLVGYEAWAEAECLLRCGWSPT